MKRFDEQELFPHVLMRGELGVAQIDRVAERLASFHRCASTRPPRSMLGTATFVRAQMETVLTSLEREAASLVPAGVRQWCEREAARLAGHFEARRAAGSCANATVIYTSITSCAKETTLSCSTASNSATPCAGSTSPATSLFR
jgi:aminoglycoside phosphotransferase family enzyme